MRIQTFSIVVGTRACNASCQFCVSRMTGFGELPRTRVHDMRALRKAVALAKAGGTTTVLLTGKGEPTLYPDDITAYLRDLDGAFPIAELQTNALDIGRLARDGSSRTVTEQHLRAWWETGLTTVAISVVDIDGDANSRVYHEDYPDLATTIGFLHDSGFSVRLCVMMGRGMVDSWGRVREVVDFCRRNEVEQCTVRPIRRPTRTEDSCADGWVRQHGLTDDEVGRIAEGVEANGTRLLTLMHGAAVYDVDGQNLCLSDCLTVEAESDDIRTLIFYGDGRITYDWQYGGALLLRGRRPRLNG